jgi:hypothetical protein
MKMLRVLTFLFLALFVNNAAGAQASLSGVVHDSSGAPLPNSSVEAVPIDSEGFVGNLTWTQTDDHGNFRLHLREGRYEIRGKKEADGYPDPNSLLSVDLNAVFPEVVVSKRDIEKVEVRLGREGSRVGRESSRQSVPRSRPPSQDHNPRRQEARSLRGTLYGQKRAFSIHCSLQASDRFCHR